MYTFSAAAANFDEESVLTSMQAGRSIFPFFFPHQVKSPFFEKSALFFYTFHPIEPSFLFSRKE